MIVAIILDIPVSYTHLPLEVISIAVGGAVGVGNIGGVATAIAVGGPGAAFWIWVAAFLGMMMKMAEVSLAVYYRSKDEKGGYYGGPTYYICLLYTSTSAMPYVSRPVELDGRFYLDGGVSDSIPVHFCKSLGYDKTVLVLTRPLEYRKERPAAWLQRFNRLYYHRYPAFVESLNRRWEVYNRQVEEIIGMEQRGELFVVRPKMCIRDR